MPTPPVLWSPQPKQAEALRRIEFEVLFGGARGGGKTDAGLAGFLYHYEHPLFRGLVIRRNADDLKDWVDRAQRFYKPFGGEKIGSPPEILFPSGAKIRTGHLKDEDAYTKYQGHEYHRMNIEELTQIASEDSYEKLIASCRSSIPELKPQVFSTTNPDGPGFEWVKARWKIPDEPDHDAIYRWEGPSKRGMVFVPSSIDDNAILLAADPNYKLTLEAIKDPDLRDAWLRGSWKGISLKGSYYGDILLWMGAKKRITNVPYNPSKPVYTVWDIGVGDDTSIGFFQPYGLGYAMIDFYANSGFGLSHYAEVIKGRGYHYGGHFAPHDIRNREWTSGVTRLETAEELGISFQIVPKLSIEDGIEATRTFLKMLWVDEVACDYALKSWRSYHRAWDDRLGVFKNEPVHDWSSHANDMLRYAAISRDLFTPNSPMGSLRDQNTYEDLNAAL